MATISQADVERVAQLGRLHLTDTELRETVQTLNSILDYFSAIQTIDTSVVVAATDVSGLNNVTRQDAVGAPLASAEELLARAPKSVRSHIQVQAVFE
ncbi:MAG: Asp-tRNA(Asn)/Glu-tRNA(Gln) amidotransferase subunit GatC [Candidatus Andersenbacteria bacterium]